MTCWTGPTWPSNLLIMVLESRSQRATEQSSEAEKRVREGGSMRTEFTKSE
jgi:hypothetical protein